MTHDNCEQQTTHSRAQDVLAEDAYTDFLRERKAYLSERKQMLCKNLAVV